MHICSEPFRELLVHKRIKPILEEILGVGYRMDHSPDLMRMEKGGDGQTLHGGAFQRYQAGGFLEGACKRLWKWAAEGKSFHQSAACRVSVPCGPDPRWDGGRGVHAR